MVIYTKPETRKRMCDRETVIIPAEKMEAMSSVKMTLENCLGTISICLFWISLTMVTLLIVIVVHVAYGGHCLQKALSTSPKYCPFA